MKEARQDRSSQNSGAVTPEERGTLLGTLSTWLGAAVALTVLLVLGTWFYQLGMRDARSVPVIRASTEPVKIRPVDAGGEVTPHQDIASYDAGSPELRPEPRPQLAPPDPEPAAEDVPMAAMVAEEPEAAQPESAPEPGPTPVTPEPEGTSSTEAASETEPEAQIAVVTSDPPPAPPSDLAAEEETPVETAALSPEPAPQPEPAPEPVAEVETPLPPVGESSGLAPAFSPAVQVRPTDLRARMARAVEDEETAQDRLVEQAAASRVKIQLRASPSRDEVVRAWSRMQSSNRDILGRKALALQTTISGGTTYYRLRVGPFRDRAEANAVCQALRARGQDCIVTTSG
ncbi:MAG: SPOR domain-containing protein [Pseudomonadota bacterium]